MKTTKRLMIMLGALCFAATLQAETRVTYKSAKSTSSYYQMAVQIAEAMKMGSGGDIIVTVEESQGSVQNAAGAGQAGNGRQKDVQGRQPQVSGDPFPVRYSVSHHAPGGAGRCRHRAIL